jgi:hypothetical protein
MLLTSPTRLVIRQELARRVVWESVAVSAKYPGRFHLELDQNARPAWHGAIPVEGRDVPVIVTYPAAYPAQPPTLETTAALAPGCPHVLGHNGDRAILCWFSPRARSPRRSWQPQRHTAATVMRSAQRWFLAFLVWQTLGEWPVPDAWDVEDL